MSNGGFGGIHGKLLDALRAREPRERRGPVTHLLYLHGFRSSPQSFKAQRLQAWVARAPARRALVVPAAAAVAARGDGAGARRHRRLAARTHRPCSAARSAASTPPWWPKPPAGRAVLLNPAVDPARDLASHIGEQTAFHDPDERFFFRAEYVDELRALRAAADHPARALLRRHRQGRRGARLARDDGALRRARTCELLEGSDHALSDFDDHLPHLLTLPASSMRLKDKVSIVTGAAQGIGLATALKFAAKAPPSWCAT